MDVAREPQIKLQSLLRCEQKDWRPIPTLTIIKVIGDIHEFNNTYGINHHGWMDNWKARPKLFDEL